MAVKLNFDFTYLINNVFYRHFWDVKIQTDSKRKKINPWFHDYLRSVWPTATVSWSPQRYFGNTLYNSTVEVYFYTQIDYNGLGKISEWTPHCIKIKKQVLTNECLL